ncbi:hypothetical protein COO60DRAFT_286769 [Scenedesmus sp. NREL 46B-D3]|nr:hypothetical protein COO60DRAFT_286769 [Scenedesmus sp. NREL 46B-D3]
MQMQHAHDDRGEEQQPDCKRRRSRKHDRPCCTQAVLTTALTASTEPQDRGQGHTPDKTGRMPPLPGNFRPEPAAQGSWAHKKKPFPCKCSMHMTTEARSSSPTAKGEEVASMTGHAAQQAVLTTALTASTLPQDRGQGHTPDKTGRMPPLPGNFKPEPAAEGSWAHKNSFPCKCSMHITIEGSLSAKARKIASVTDYAAQQAVLTTAPTASILQQDRDQGHTRDREDAASARQLQTLTCSRRQLGTHKKNPSHANAACTNYRRDQQLQCTFIGCFARS